MATINILIMHLTVNSTMYTISTFALKTFKDKLSIQKNALLCALPPVEYYFSLSYLISCLKFEGHLGLFCLQIDLFL